MLKVLDMRKIGCIIQGLSLYNLLTFKKWLKKWPEQFRDQTKKLIILL